MKLICSSVIDTFSTDKCIGVSSWTVVMCSLLASSWYFESFSGVYSKDVINIGVMVLVPPESMPGTEIIELLGNSKVDVCS